LKFSLADDCCRTQPLNALAASKLNFITFVLVREQEKQESEWLLTTPFTCCVCKTSRRYYSVAAPKRLSVRQNTPAICSRVAN